MRGIRADLVAVAVQLALVAAAAALGAYLNRPESGVVLFEPAPPIFAIWQPHAGWGTAPAVLLAVLVVCYGPTATRLRLRYLLPLGYLCALGWTFSLAMIDGWRTGLAGRLVQWPEYLHDVPGITDIPRMLATFSARIPVGVPGSWTTHVSGHPPGATLFFVWLERIGLPGGGPAAVACVLFGCLAVVAVPATLALLGRPDAARSMLPFLVLFPGAVWIGASADAVFTGVSASAIALLALATRCRVPVRVPVALAAGLLLGCTLYLSYGLVLIGLLAVAVLIYTRSWSVAVLAILGVLAVVAAFTLAGFWWFDGYAQLHHRYYHDDVGAMRPYWYWVWANLASLVLAVGPAVLPALRRAFAHRRSAVVLLAGAALLAVLLADLSGMSKAEVERIWLPFDVWLLAATALLPARGRRWWLLAQAGTALLVNHLLLTNW